LTKLRLAIEMLSKEANEGRPVEAHIESVQAVPAAEGDAADRGKPDRECLSLRRIARRYRVLADRRRRTRWCHGSWPWHRR
jgi:hypothetical protein